MGQNQLKLVYPNFVETCHPQLRKATINKQQNSLELYTAVGDEYEQWRWNLYPIKNYHKRLVLPIYFNDENRALVNCSPRNQTSFQAFSIAVGYEPFAYTLSNEIIIRKIKNTYFTEKQIWKILKGLIQALKDWTTPYEQLPIGQIKPDNIVFDLNGQMKFVHLFSFPSDGILTIRGKAHLYGEVNPKNKLTVNRVSKQVKQSILTVSLNEIGKTLISMIIREQQYNAKNQELQHLINSDQKCSLGLKELIFDLISPNIKQKLYLDKIIGIISMKKKQFD